MAATEFGPESACVGLQSDQVAFRLVEAPDANRHSASTVKPRSRVGQGPEQGPVGEEQGIATRSSQRHEPHRRVAIGAEELRSLTRH